MRDLNTNAMARAQHAYDMAEPREPADISGSFSVEIDGMQIEGFLPSLDDEVEIHWMATRNEDWSWGDPKPSPHARNAVMAALSFMSLDRQVEMLRRVKTLALHELGGGR